MEKFCALKIGDKSDNGQVSIVDEDRLCYIIRSESKGAIGLRTISKAMLAEFIDFVQANPETTANEARVALTGKSELDKFEYGYASTYVTMAQMVLSRGIIGEKQSNKLEQRSNSFQTIFYGAPGTGKSFRVKEITGERDGEEKKNVFRTTFHPDTDYAAFVGCYKPTMEDVPEKYRAVAGHNEEIAYKFVPQVFSDAYVYAYKNPEETTFLVIEEINRGNCAQIFGDLFQLLDRKEDGISEYAIKADKDLQNFLEKELGKEHMGIAGGKLRLPANLHIIATMNTSDQSLFPMDSAFKRRWDWEYVPICYTEERSGSFVITIGSEQYRWVDFIKAINTKIFDITQSEDKQLGNFFIKSSVDAAQFKSKVMFYLWNEVLRDEIENTNYFFYSGDERFTFKDLYTPQADRLLQGFMAKWEVKSITHKEEEETTEGALAETE